MEGERIRIILACGHTAFVTHLFGERHKRCLACGVSSIIVAATVIKRRYEVKPANENFEFDGF